MEMIGFGYGRPVWSLQFFLREIAYHDNRVPMVIPDGIFGAQTKASVEGFQSVHGLPRTGEVDFATWERVVEVYRASTASAPRPVSIFPDDLPALSSGDSSEHLFAIQGMLLALSRRFPQLGAVGVTGVHDEKSTAAVKQVQSIAGLEPTGVLDRNTWEHLSRLYEAFVSRDRITPVE